MNCSLNRFVASSSLVAVIALATSQSMAGPPAADWLDQSVTVRFDDLNTSTAEGGRVLYERINSAVHDICGRLRFSYPKELWKEKQCFRATLDETVTKLNLPAVTAMHLSTTHRSAAPPELQASNHQ